MLIARAYALRQEVSPRVRDFTLTSNPLQTSITQSRRLKVSRLFLFWWASVSKLPSPSNQHPPNFASQVPLNAKRDTKHQHNTPGSTTRLELRSEEWEQWQGEHTTIGRKSEWIILGVYSPRYYPFAFRGCVAICSPQSIAEPPQSVRVPLSAPHKKRRTT